MFTTKLTVSVEMTHEALLKASNEFKILAGLFESKINASTIGSGTGTPPPPLPPETEVAAPPPPETEIVNTSGVELDTDGLPWDGRIHGARKLKTKKDGTWKKIRGVSPDLVVKVEAELRATMAAPATEAAAPPPPATEAAAPPPPATEAAAPPPPATEAAAPPPPVIHEPEPVYIIDGKEYTKKSLQIAGWPDDKIDALPHTNPVPIMTFPEMLQKATAYGKTPDEIKAAVVSVGLESTALLGARPDLVPAVAEKLNLS